MFTTVAYSRNLIFNLLLNEFKCVLHSTRRLHTRTHTRISSGNKEQLVILEVLHSQLQSHTLIARGKINKNGNVTGDSFCGVIVASRPRECEAVFNVCCTVSPTPPLPDKLSSPAAQDRGSVFCWLKEPIKSFMSEF